MKSSLFGDDQEQRVESMIAAGRKIVDEALKAYRPVAVFAGWSGGNDSVVSTHFACENYGATAIHCNTMIGMKSSHEHARNVAAKFGWSYSEKIATPTGKPKRHRDGSPFNEANLHTGKWIDGETAYEEFCLNFGMPGPGQHARMYQRLKERSFQAWKREAKEGNRRDACVVIITGIRHDESAIRAGYQRAVQKVGGTVWVNPFYWHSKRDFQCYRDEFGLPENRNSALIGISGECLCGTMGTRDELELIRQVEPETAAYIESLESRCASLGLPCKWATKPERVSRCNDAQLLLWGDEPEFMPACVGCIRRNR